MILYSLAQYIVPMTILISLNAKLLKELQRSSRTLRASVNAGSACGVRQGERGGTSTDPAQVEAHYETFEVRCCLADIVWYLWYSKSVYNQN